MRLLITGSTGMAAATAKLAREKGHLVATVGLDESADIHADLREEDQVERGFREGCRQLGGAVDALFNCAGISGRRYGDGALHEVTAEGLDETLRSNMRSLFLMSRAAVRHWLEVKQSGVVLNMGSVTPFSPEPAHFAAHAYAAAKGGIEALTVSTAAYYAKHGIRINAILPGLVRTPMSLRAQSNAEILDFIAHKQPLTGILEPEQVARVALFLLSPESATITGQLIRADGGWAVST